MFDKQTLSQQIKAEALRLGFDVCGIAQAEPVSKNVETAFRNWLKAGNQATMDYMTNHLEKRLDPTLLVEGTRSIICVAMNYFPKKELEGYKLAWYAYGKDYHEVMKERLNHLLQSIRQWIPEATGRCFCDTAPIMERYWAEKAGLGWRGKNTQLIIPHHGTSFFLGEIFLNLELDYDQPIENHCGHCTTCQDQCPMHALYIDSQTEIPLLNSTLCLSYQTIENRGEISPEAQKKLRDCIYGCDICQKVCPHNKFAKATSHLEFHPSDKLLHMTIKDWHNLTIEEYRTLFKGSAVKRAKYEGLIRNIRAVQAGSPSEDENG